MTLQTKQLRDFTIQVDNETLYAINQIEVKWLMYQKAIELIRKRNITELRLSDWSQLEAESARLILSDLGEI